MDEATRATPYKPPIPLTVIVNPVIEPLSDETLLINEGCLSVPDLRGDVPRYLRVRVQLSRSRWCSRHEEVEAG